MQISNNSSQYAYSQMQALMAGAETDAGQDMPGGAADFPALAAADGQAATATNAAPSRPLSTDMLSSLIALQAQGAQGHRHGHHLHHVSMASGGSSPAATAQMAVNGA